tara:strand:+ start:5812 stop:6405 length:594 start_codon:yes stop_codon:yes gene_type:complete
MIRKGFTIIEVLISLVILSIITLITSNILKSSLDTESTTTKHLNSIKSINLSSSKIRRDLRQIVNIKSRDFFGNKMNGSFIYDERSNSMIFNSYVRSISEGISPIKRIEYIYEDSFLKRRQYFTASPYNQDEFVESILLTDIEEFNVSLFDYDNWHSSWPIKNNQSSKIPTLVKIEFLQKNKSYIWIVEPNISYASN